MTPFDYVKAINYTKEDLMVDEVSEKTYNLYYQSCFEYGY